MPDMQRTDVADSGPSLEHAVSQVQDQLVPGMRVAGVDAARSNAAADGRSAD